MSTPHFRNQDYIFVVKTGKGRSEPLIFTESRSYLVVRNLICMEGYPIKIFSCFVSVEIKIQSILFLVVCIICCIHSWGLRYVTYVVMTNVKSTPTLLRSSSVCTIPNKQECQVIECTSLLDN